MDAFRNGELVQIDTSEVTALARVREQRGFRLHIALEVGEYLPWVEEIVVVRGVGQGAVLGPHAKRCRMLHAGNATALLEIVDTEIVHVPPPPMRGPFGTLPLIDEQG